jgi:LysM repeat protein
MRPLSEHLTDRRSHAGLPFHPNCPICREERLAGALSAQPVVSNRARAGLAALLLAASGGPAWLAPTLAAADEPATTDVGNSQEEGGSDADQNTDLEPGPQDSVDGLDEQAPVEEVGVPDDSTAPGNEESLDVREPTDPGPQDVDESPVEQQQEQADAPASPPKHPAPDAKGGHSPEPASKGKPAARAKRQPAQPKHPAAPQVQAAPVVQQAPQQAPVQQAAATVPASQPAAAETDSPPTGGGKTHVVQQGETLWSIARDVLGSGASSAQVAREVNQLWRLNADRIGTGSPDMIMAGQKLVLP